MKKFITIASILAAGTMFANAATNLDLADEPTSSGVSYPSSYYSLSGMNAQEITLTKIGFDANTNYALSYLSFLVSSYQSLPTFKNIAIVDSTGTVLGVSGTMETATSQTWCDGSTGKTIAHVDFDYSAANATILNSSTTYYAVFLSGTVDVGTKLTSSSPVVTPGNNLYTYVGDTGTARVLTFNSKTDGGGIATSPNYVYSTVTLSSVYSAKAYKVIPEPSMFGLLAGTLALGLAGTRRRRR